MKSWRPKEARDLPNGLILFDGVCVFCCRSVQFVLERDRDRWFRFAPIQSAFGRALAERLGISAEMPETNAVIIRGRAHFKADSAIEVLRLLPRWSWARVLSLAPRSLRDFIYDWVAQRRYRLFGRTTSCMVPTSEISARFVFGDAGERAAFAGRLSPFQELLGGDFARLPAAVRRVHAVRDSLKTSGRAKVSVAAGVGPWLICRLAGLHSPGQEIPVEVEFHPDGHLREYWERRFGERCYASTMHIGEQRAPGLLVERFGPLALEFRLEARGEGSTARLCWSLAGCRLFGARLPQQAQPRIECTESADGERFLFDIDVAFPMIGHVIHCGGWLSPDAPDGSETS